MLIYLLGDVLRIYSGDMAKAMADQEFQPARLAGDRGFDVDANPDGFPDPGIAPDRYITNSCWWSAWGSMWSRSGMRGIGVEPYN